ncbi:aldo/keto reductase [Pararhizobium mangrovi]|uniref:Aldo/keto reductase n=1 Tax=Pararhizobium mangrovi TaxID=2590452 RepID=A0A506UC82_9HYPH|nr:aldo/keto reductase [Pararhizobium mangrovi]TPW31198.1 aldo/keto reductase [Pararhizobium mangrovi]
MDAISAGGAEIPVIGFGTWTLKGDACTDLVSEALAAGYRHIDTAIMYGNEEEVGKAIAGSSLARDDVFLTSKVWYTDIGPGDLERAAEASLGRLGVETLDLLLIHWPNPQIPLADSIGALNRARERGLARHIGVSNFTIGMLEEAVELSDAPIVCNQVESHPMLDQRRVHAACREHDVAMTAYAPLGRGEALSADPVKDAAEAHGKTAGQVVLRWHVQQGGITCIPRSSHAERVRENIDIFDFELSDAEMDAIGTLRSANYRICDADFAPTWDAP